MTTEADIGVTQSKAEESGSHQNLEKARKRFSPEASREGVALLILAQ